MKNNLSFYYRYDLLTVSVSVNYTNRPSLRPGIYLLVMDSNLGLIIHWPEIGCYENTSDASSQIKRNMVNLHRCCFYFFFFLALKV
jgi:hypothetical protein